jgi:ubiquinone/menaquinone biosynthesis C-methylase UbiE
MDHECADRLLDNQQLIRESVTNLFSIREISVYHMTIKVPGGSELLDPKNILEKIGLEEGMTVADLGCGGMGYFTLQAAHLVGKSGKVFAVDILPFVLKNVEERAKARSLDKIIKTILSNLEILGATRIKDESLGVALLINIFFQTKKHENILREAVRLVKKGGKIVVIDWKKTASPFGPPVKNRVGAEEVKKLALKIGLKEKFGFEAGSYHYGIVFERE